MMMKWGIKDEEINRAMKEERGILLMDEAWRTYDERGRSDK